MAATAEKYDKYTSIDQLPALFPVKTLAQVMGINITAAYQLVKRQEFNCSITIGSKIMIVKEHYKKWLDNQVLCEEFKSGYKDLNQKEQDLYKTAFNNAVDFLEKNKGQKVDKEKIEYLFK